ncbi:MAG: MFS transporter [Gemmatimonadetes bacterium]|nr:MFS transporter [Gemmatimonadota bacterium]
MLARVRFALRALRHRDLRLFLLGQGISLIGTWMQQVAMSWLVYRMTGSTLVLGLIAFCSQFPTFLVAGPAGALADRWSRHRMVFVAQIGLMVEATILAVLVLTGTAEVWHLVVLAIWSGLCSGFDVPARQALLVRFVNGEDLANAIALNSSIFNGARLVGPALAGALIAWLGEGPVFVLNALSYVAVLVALWAVDTRDVGTRGGDSVLRTMGEGYRYAFGFPPIRAILVLLALISMVGLPYSVLLPVFAADVLHGSAGTLGFLSAAAGLGALAGALTLASRESVQGLGDFIVRCLVIFGAALVAFAFSRNLWLSAVAMAVAGFGIMATTSAMNTILQTLVEERMRGRVMALYTMAFIGLSPVGALASGALAHRIGAPLTVGGGGAACVLLAFWFARQIPDLREMVLPIYRRLGIIPEVADGLQAASDPRVKE